MGSARLFGLTTGACAAGVLSRGSVGGATDVRAPIVRSDPPAGRDSAVAVLLVGCAVILAAGCATRSDPAARFAAGILSASTLKSALPAVSVSPRGTTTARSQRGHLSVRPARSSGTISVCPVGHLILSGMRFSLNRRRPAVNLAHAAKPLTTGIPQGVPEEGLEPTRPCGHWILNPARLPFRHSGMQCYRAAAIACQASQASVDEKSRHDCLVATGKYPLPDLNRCYRTENPGS